MDSIKEAKVKKVQEKKEKKMSQRSQVFAKAVAGGTAGAVAATILYPIDVRTKLGFIKNPKK